jgi:hypothetical protein
MDIESNHSENDQTNTKKNKSKISFWAIIFLISSFLFLSTWIIQPLLLHLGYWNLLESPISHKSLKVASFDSRGSGALAQPQIFDLRSAETGSSNENIDIRFNFKFHSLKNLEDLFQTGVANEGIRIESDEKGDLVIIVGANNPAGYVSAIVTHVFFPLFYSIAPNTWHSMRIHSWNRHAVSVWLDGIRVTSLVDPAIQWRTTEVKVGRGFGEERPFDGKIKDFKLNHSWFNSSVHHFTQSTLSVLSILTFILSVFAFIKCLPSILSKDEKIAWLSQIILLGFIAMVSYNFIASVYLGLGYPFNSFLFLPDNPFSDYYVLPVLNEYLNPYYGVVAYGALYFPFAYLFTYPCVWFPHLFPILMNFGFVIAIYLFVAHYFSLQPINNSIRIMNAKNIFIIAFLTYPFLCAFERGNIEVILFIMMALSLYFYKRQHFYKSACLISLGAAMKLFPILMITIFLSDKKFKPVLFSIGMFFVLTAISLMCLQGGFYHNLMGLVTAIHNTDQTYSTMSIPSIAGWPGHWPSIELLTVFKLFYFKLRHTALSIKAITVYHIATLLGFAVIALYIIFIEHSFWKKVMLIICAMLLFPILSFQYKLIYLYLPLAFFVNETRQSQQGHDNYYLVLFALMMVPASYFYTKNGIFSLTSILDTSILVIFMADIVARGCYSRFRHIFVERDKLPQKTELISNVEAC